MAEYQMSYVGYVLFSLVQLEIIYLGVRFIERTSKSFDINDANKRFLEIHRENSSTALH